MPRGKGGPFHNYTWPEETRTAEVVAWAVRQTGDVIVLFAAAMQDQDAHAALLHLKRMRNVVTRMDQFRRMKVRKWLARQTSSAKN